MKFFLNILIGILSIAILIFLYQNTQLLDTKQHNRLVYTLQEIKQLDATLTEEVLISRLSLNNNYDNFVTITNAIEQRRNNWLAFDIASIYGKHPYKEEKQKNDYLALLEEKNELVEQFKGVNAILSNSVRYFPITITELKEFTEVSNLKLLAEPANKLLAAVLEYSLVSNAKTRAQISSMITTLEAINVTDEDLIEQISIISSHARNIVKYKQKIDLLLEKIAALDRAFQIDRLTDTYVTLQDSRLQETEPYRKALIIFSAILLLWIAYIAYQLRLSYKEIDAANVQLQINNETLEKRVEERTKALSDAFSDLKESQSQLILFEKMASLGRLVAGFAHELNTPIGVAVGSSSTLQNQVNHIKELFEQDEVDEDELISALGTIDEAATLTLSNLMRAANLVESFKRTAVDQTSEELRQFDVEITIKDVINTLHNQFKQTTIEIELDCPKDLLIYSIPGSLQQIVTNLMINSLMHGFKCGKKSGIIRICVHLEESCLHIDYSDTGKGITPEALEKIFEPFFTTDRTHGSSGLGMYISYNIVTSQLNGTMTCESILDQGVNFKIEYPVTLSFPESNH